MRLSGTLVIVAAAFAGACAVVALFVGTAMLVGGSLEMVPTAEQQAKVDVVGGTFVLGSLVVVAAAVVVARRWLAAGDRPVVAADRPE
jgi:hypothetical protein